MSDMLALDDVTVLEIADQRGEMLGKLLASMGAAVIKIEPPAGSPSRSIGPFYHDVPHRDRSLHFWHYNQGKQGITLDIETRDGQELLKRMVPEAQLLIETSRPGYMDELSLGFDALHAINPGLVMLSITDFGQTGPHKDYKATDLIQLALGGITMVSGYPPDADGKWDTPPMAPQAWQSVHMSNCMAAFDVLSALWYQRMAGKGQYIDHSMHAAANATTENWLARYLTAGLVSQRSPSFKGDVVTRDGYNMITMTALFPGEWEREVAMLEKAGAAEDLTDERFSTAAGRNENRARIDEVRKKYVAQQDAQELFVNAQSQGVIWATVRPPEDSLDDPHFVDRGNFTQVEHPELGESFTYPGAPWISPAMPWRNGKRAPLLGEHNVELYERLLGITKQQLVMLAQAGVV